MQCDFCGCDLPLIFTTNDKGALFNNFEDTDVCEPGGHLCLDLTDHCIYEFYHTETIQSPNGYKHLCKKCSAGLDAFGSALLEQDCRRRVLNYRNIAANTLNKNRGKEIPPHIVGVDVGVKDHPVAQVCRRDGDRWVLTNMIRGDAVGHLVTYMEDSEYVK